MAAPDFRPFFAMAFVAATLACGGGSSPAPEERNIAPVGTIFFEFEPGVSASDRKLIAEASDAARAYFKKELGRDLRYNLTFVVTTTDGAGYLGFSYGRKAWLFTGSKDWLPPTEPLSVESKYQLVAHEMFHNFQSDAAYTDDGLPSYSPSWLLEGTAEYAAARFLDSRGDWDMETALSQYKLLVRRARPNRLGVSRVVSLEEYAKAALAADRLLAGRELSLVADYFADTGYMDWRDAFVKHFGKPVDAFIEEFEASLLR